ncbi:glutathione S-transferase family protein [Aromatoleum anaerobium]|uniref:Glutathione S-transferase family protein n=2 Tax=Aromatoleum TaxID=551759 RepID=A0N0U0_9RHOO|nr:glutathione S-transferase family protein [Aromatoleum anaerobium]ABK58618.1 putative glutathione S-transferase [Aromatoleum anaerobium]MCK0505383.1 glutathione S-transferase family protein [Aromatoleum anaerobium]
MAGYLNRGVWHSAERARTNAEGAFLRDDSQFRDRVTADGAGNFKAEAGRYHLYVSLACPWAHRTLLYRALKGLQDAIGVSVVDPVSGDEGWVFSDYPGATPDHANGLTALHQLYTLAQPDYSGRVTVPVLWDKASRRIVNNESADIIRILNDAFVAFEHRAIDFYPQHLRAEIDAVNAFVYENVNNGVYRCGFATSQAAYDQAVLQLFAALDRLEERLSRHRYLVGNRLTEADMRLFPTLVRFDAVYFIHFKCSVRRIADYPNLSGYLRDIYQMPGVSETVNMDHIKRHYYLSHRHLNPTGIIPAGPDFDFAGRHDRQRFQE